MEQDADVNPIVLRNRDRRCRALVGVAPALTNLQQVMFCQDVAHFPARQQAWPT